MPTTAAAHAQNPFMLMLDPQSILDAVERSHRLEELTSHICRPLDRQGPSNGKSADGAEASDDTDFSDSDTLLPGTGFSGLA